MRPISLDLPVSGNLMRSSPCKHPASYDSGEHACCAYARACVYKSKIWWQRKPSAESLDTMHKKVRTYRITLSATDLSSV